MHETRSLQLQNHDLRVEAQTLHTTIECLQTALAAAKEKLSDGLIPTIFSPQVEEAMNVRPDNPGEVPVWRIVRTVQQGSEVVGLVLRSPYYTKETSFGVSPEEAQDKIDDGDKSYQIHEAPLAQPTAEHARRLLVEIQKIHGDELIPVASVAEAD